MQAVWFRKDDAFQLYSLSGDDYRKVERSVLLPELDFAVLASFVRRDDQHRAVREFRDLLRGE